MDRLIDAYTKWPPFNQLGFAALLAVLLFLLVVMAGAWVGRMAYYFVALVRGWPDDVDDPAPAPAEGWGWKGVARDRAEVDAAFADLRTAAAAAAEPAQQKPS
jgi:hypothetical protein